MTRSLAEVDGRLRDYSPAALQKEDVRLAEFRAHFAALAPASLSARRRIDRSVALAQIDFLLHQHQVRRHQLRSLDSYVDEPFRGVDWQIQGMTRTGASSYGTEAEWRAVIARCRAVPGYLATAERQLGAGAEAHSPPDWRVLRDFGLQTSAADAEYFAKTLAQIGAADIAAPQRDALLRELQDAGNEAAAAYRHLHDFVAGTFFDDPSAADRAGLKPAYRADRYAMGAAEYDWALRNNLRLGGSAAELFASSWPIVQATRAQMIALAGQIAASHGWPARGGGAALVRMVFEQLSQNAPHSDAEMVEGYRQYRPAPGRVRAHDRAVRRAGRLPAGGHGDPAAAARLDRGRGLLPGAAVQEERCGALLRDAHG